MGGSRGRAVSVLLPWRRRLFQERSLVAERDTNEHEHDDDTRVDSRR
jgi:hypothetical protein